MTDAVCGCCGRSAPFVAVGEVDATDVAQRFALERCTACRVLRTGPVPADLAPYYATDLAATMSRPASPWFATLRRLRLAHELRRLTQLGDPGVVVDIGCGAGDFVEVLRAQGIDVVAADASPEPPAALAGRDDVPYVRFDFDRYALVSPPRPPAAAILRHVLEHLRAPRACLERLRAQGVRLLYLVVPNAGSRECRLLGSRWYLWDPPRHLWHFDPGSLAAVCGAAGFEVVASGEDTAPILLPSLYRGLRQGGWPAWLYEWFGPTSALTTLTAPVNLLLAGNVTWVVARARSPRGGSRPITRGAPT